MAYNIREEKLKVILSLWETRGFYWLMKDLEMMGYPDLTKDLKMLKAKYNFELDQILDKRSKLKQIKIDYENNNPGTE